MSESILKRYTGRTVESLAEARAASESAPMIDNENADDLGAFAHLRGLRDRAIMLELRKKDGSITAIGYCYLERAEYDPSDGITLHVLGQKIRLKGRNLNAEVRPAVRLFEGITRHKVAWVREADPHESMTAADGDTVIDAID
ncbi:MAG: hypothetical protein DCC65_08195 [Planctomycetota bacterium]|nr:MAG: hypothetical protein DCC65_08195 [Planctomycetota bacterium]